MTTQEYVYAAAMYRDQIQRYKPQTIKGGKRGRLAQIVVDSATESLVELTLCYAWQKPKQG